MSFESFPFMIGWELTLGCNLLCRHCASSAGAERQRELTLEESLAICRQFPDLMVDEVVFTGGEPLLNPHWAAIAECLTSLDIKTGMVTNGTLLTADIVSRMIDSGLKAVGISIDGPKEVHDSLRGVPWAFDQAVRGIELLRKGGVDVTVITSVTAENISLLESMYRLVRSLGAWKWQIQPLFPLGRGQSQEALYLSRQQFLEMGQFIQQARLQGSETGVEVVPADSCGYFSHLDFPEFGWRGCGAGRFSCGIMSDGRVKGCLSWPDSTVEGNLRENDLWEIWFHPQAFKKLRNFGAEDLKGECRTCEVGMECGGGCQAMSLAAAGDWHADPYCYRVIDAAQKAEEERPVPITAV